MTGNLKLSILLVAILFLGYLLISDVRYYSGDGRVERGLLFYPIFEVHLGELDIGLQQSASYTISGLPSYELDFAFVLVKKDGPFKRWKEIDDVFLDLESRGVRIGVKLSTNNSNYDTVFSIEECLITTSWIINGSIYAPEFWNKESSDLKLGRNIEYKLDITISSIMDLSASYKLVPIIRGGGITLP